MPKGIYIRRHRPLALWVMMMMMMMMPSPRSSGTQMRVCRRRTARTGEIVARPNASITSSNHGQNPRWNTMTCPRVRRTCRIPAGRRIRWTGTGRHSRADTGSSTGGTARRAAPLSARLAVTKAPWAERCDMRAGVWMASH